MKKIKNQSINSDAYAYLKGIIAHENKILDAYVRGKWLTAELSSGVRFSVKNESFSPSNAWQKADYLLA